MSPTLRLATAALLGSVAPAAEPARPVDFRFATDFWHTSLNRPDDWHKQLADDRGSLLYDFGPGPYVKAQTTVALGVADGELKRVAQRLVHPRLALLRTELAAGDGARVTVETASVWPAQPSPTRLDFGDWQRLDGASGALGWAHPPAGTAPEFHAAAWGTNRPVRYRVRVAPGASTPVALGFCESYRTRPGLRLAVLRVEGAPEQTADLATGAPLNTPQVFRFEARDANRDGWLDLSVNSVPGADVNTMLSLIQVGDRRLACGAELARQPARTDVIRAEFTGPATRPQVLVRTGRALAWSVATSELLDAGPDTPAAWLHARPRPASAARDAHGWTLTFPAGTRAVEVFVRSGAADPAARWPESARAALDGTRATQEAFRGIPYDAIRVPDPALQAFMDSALRPAWQAREQLHDRLEWHPGFTLYRGLWADFVLYGVETAALLGDLDGARRGLAALWETMDADGKIRVFEPDPLLRETPITLWLACRYARRSGDWAWVRARWAGVMRGLRECRRMRERTLADPAAANYGLMPASFADGGLHGLTAEYSTVFAALEASDEIARAARRLGFAADAAEAQKFFAELFASYRAAAARDTRRDSHGNPYLPLAVGLRGDDPLPQLAQWGTLEFYAYAGFVPRDDALIRGTVALHRAVERQGLPHSTGWLRGGIWAGYGLYYARGLILTGDAEHAADTLYAVANHASPTGTWPEEQPLAGSGGRTAGDHPHTWHGLELWRVVAMMLAHERGDELVLCDALPAAWLAAGAATRMRINTIFGPLDFALDVAADGRRATLRATLPPAPPDGATARVNPAAFARAGFTAPVAPPPVWGRETTWEFSR